MLRASFYLLTRGGEARLLTTCRLIDKAVSSGLNVYLQVEDDHEAHLCDDWLWQFRAESFLPHHRMGTPPFVGAPVLIGLKTPAESDGVCVNISRRPIDNLAQFQRLLEVVAPDEAARQAARQRWRQYKQQGFILETHELRD